MINDLDLTEEEQLRAWCVDQVVMMSNPGLPPNVIVNYAQILQDHIRPRDADEKSDGSDYAETAQNVNEYDEATQQGPKDFFRSELKQLINRHSIDNELNTPDWLLAEALVRCLDNLADFSGAQAKWELETGRARIEPETKFVRRPGDMRGL